MDAYQKMDENVVQDKPCISCHLIVCVQSVAPIRLPQMMLLFELIKPYWPISCHLIMCVLYFKGEGYYEVTTI